MAAVQNEKEFSGCLYHLHLGPKIVPNPYGIITKFNGLKYLKPEQKIEWSKMFLSNQTKFEEMTDVDLHRFFNDYGDIFKHYSVPDMTNPESILYVYQPSIFTSGTIEDIPLLKEEEPQLVFGYNDVRNIVEALGLIKFLDPKILENFQLSLPSNCLTFNVQSYEGFTYSPTLNITPLSKGISESKKFYDNHVIMLRQNFSPLCPEKTNWIFEENVIRQNIPIMKENNYNISVVQYRKDFAATYVVIDLLQDYLSCTDRAVLKLAFPEIKRKKCKKKSTNLWCFGVLKSKYTFEFYPINLPECLCSCNSIESICNGENIDHILKYTFRNSNLEMPVAIFEAKDDFKKELTGNSVQRILSIVNWTEKNNKFAQPDIIELYLSVKN